MRLLRLRGATRGLAGQPEFRSSDLVRRDWFREAPDLVWAADFTHVRTCEGWINASFLQDAFSPPLRGFTVCASVGGGTRDRRTAAGRERAPQNKPDVRG